MRKAFFTFLSVFTLFLLANPLYAVSAEPVEQEVVQTTTEHQEENTESTANHHQEELAPQDSAHQAGHAVEETEEGGHHQAPGWLVIPFVVLLLMIATGPLFYEHFWHKNYPKIAVLLAAFVVGYYLFILHDMHGPVHALAEYVQFIALLSSLYVASGGILIRVGKKATPLLNTTILLIGGVIANLIGTTGASMLLIRPFIRINKHRIKAYHIIFFIFIVSNIGGALTPIGDPPLFLGFLKGVPFFWTLENNLGAWIFALLLLAVFFYILDRRNKEGEEEEANAELNGGFQIIGSRNFLWLAVVIGSVFLDPNVLDWVPAIHYDGQKFSFIRELIMFTVALLSYKLADQKAIKGNEFNFEPIREVAFIFIGIFGTMMPALAMVAGFAKSPAGAELISHNTLYWGTGLLSGFLDNAPTYLNFLAAAMASVGKDINQIQEVQAYAAGAFNDSLVSLQAISVAAVFFGAMTYIGNGPNFMVKSIAEQTGIKMPSFFGYIVRYSLPVLLPILILVWIVFFALH